MVEEKLIDYLMGVAIQKRLLPFCQNVWERSNDRHTEEKIRGGKKGNYKLQEKNFKRKNCNHIIPYDNAVNNIYVIKIV